MPNLTSLSGIGAGNSAEESQASAPDAWLSRDGKKAMTDAERQSRIESGQLGIARDYPTALYRVDEGPILHP